MSNPRSPSLFLPDNDPRQPSDDEDEKESNEDFQLIEQTLDRVSASHSSEEHTSTGLWGSSGSPSSSSDPGCSSHSSPRPSTSSHHPPSRLFTPFVQGPLRILIQRVVHERANVVVTGPAGSGKTSMLMDLIERLKATRRDKAPTIYALAPTQAAATAIGGTTIHSWSGIDFGFDSQDDRAQSVYIKKHIKNRWRGATTLFIDEVSQIDGNLFSLLDGMGRRLRNLQSPFEGIQTEAWAKAVQCHIRLVGTYRTLDPDESIAFIHSLARPLSLPPDIEITELFPCVRDADEANLARLKTLPGPTKTFTSIDTTEGLSSLQRHAVLASFPVPRTLQLRVGALIILRRSTTPELTAGRTGSVYDFITLSQWQKWGLVMAQSRPDVALIKIGHNHSAVVEGEAVKWPVIRFSSEGKTVFALVGLETWQWEGSAAGSTLGARIQVPLTLGWARTIHQVQGQSLAAVRVDLRRSFECGQVYVALSRVSSADRIQIVGFSPSSVSADPTTALYEGKPPRSASQSNEPPLQIGHVDFISGAVPVFTEHRVPLYDAPPFRYEPKKRDASRDTDVRVRLLHKVKHSSS
ncbi:hypothetical protein A4X13_0g4644 [Tilletia indica]|uniref:ATP-dependent DNA helicase n=1 Tax=Tilletia indica TaxID=43049 RepID=A0A8T8SYG9_9BASI|nr:hypothetical protein A4X13_0g4644 [Tilletia indica]